MLEPMCSSHFVCLLLWGQRGWGTYMSLYLSVLDSRSRKEGPMKLCLGHVFKGIDGAPKTVPYGGEVTASKEIRVLCPENEE